MTYDNAQAAGSVSKELRIKMHAMYDHFPDCHPVEGLPYIECYSDTYVSECVAPGKNNIALLLEPKSMIGQAYEYVKAHHDYFAYIFTHDSELLKLPNAKFFLWCNLWLQSDEKKDKSISLCTSYKNWCPLHNARLELAKYYEKTSQVDVYYGDWNNPSIPTIEPRTYLSRYKYSIVIENDIDDYWFTEKILNCFGTKTVPIYVGATKIHEFFNPDGIIRVDNWEDIPKIINNLDLDREYETRKEAIEDNYRRAEKYKTGWKERFFSDYDEILEELANE